MTRNRTAEKVREPHAVAARDFTHNFGRYKMEAQRHAVPVSSHGSVIGYFVGAREYEDRMAVLRSPEGSGA